MKSIANLCLLAIVAIPLACKTAEERNADRAAVGQPPLAPGYVTHVIVLHNQDARTAANYARREFGIPPMEGVVQVRVDTEANSWIAQGSEHDVTRIDAIAARYDQPGEPIWTKK